jgi:hypothetical protein
MDDRYSEYVIALGQLFAAAALARLRVEVATAQGQLLVGLVGAPRAAEGEMELDDTGLKRTVRIDSALVNLDEIVRCTIYPPRRVASGNGGVPR